MIHKKWFLVNIIFLNKSSKYIFLPMYHIINNYSLKLINLKYERQFHKRLPLLWKIYIIMIRSYILPNLVAIKINKYFTRKIIMWRVHDRLMFAGGCGCSNVQQGLVSHPPPATGGGGGSVNWYSRWKIVQGGGYCYAFSSKLSNICTY